MLFVMCTSPSYFQRCIKSILARYIVNGAQVYLNDIIIYSNTMDEHKKMVSVIPLRLDTHNIHGQKAKSYLLTQKSNFEAIFNITRNLNTENKSEQHSAFRFS
jgi:hypothetical protein